MARLTQDAGPLLRHTAVLPCPAARHELAHAWASHCTLSACAWRVALQEMHLIISLDIRRVGTPLRLCTRRMQLAWLTLSH